MEAVSRRVFRGGRAIVVLAMVGAVGLALWGLGLAMDPARALSAYLAAWAFAVFLTVGTLIFVAISYAANTTWVAPLRRLAGAIVATLPLLLLGFVPIVLGLDHLYLWADPPAHLDPHEVEHLHHQAPFLGDGFFVVRGLVYFGCWIAIAATLRHWSRGRERAAREGRAIAEETPNGRERVLCSATLPVLAVTLTFAAFDWLMSLDPFWWSTIYGIYVFAGGILAGLAVLTFLAWVAHRSGALPELTADHFHALGRMLLTFVVFWAYTAFFQAMLIQIANLPEEVTFYLVRTEGVWMGVTWLLIFGHFAVPFALLLLRRIKRIPAWMGLMSLWLLVLCFVDDAWLVLPAHDLGLHWVDAAAFFGVVGATAAFGAWRQRGVSLLAEGDPYLARGLAYRSRS